MLKAMFKATWNVIRETIRGVDMAHAILHRTEASPRTFKAVRVSDEGAARPVAAA